MPEVKDDAKVADNTSQTCDLLQVTNRKLDDLISKFSKSPVYAGN